MELLAADGATVVAAAAAAAADAAAADTEVADAAVAVAADASCLRQLHMGTEDHIFIIGTNSQSPATHQGYQITCCPPENMSN